MLTLTMSDKKVITRLKEVARKKTVKLEEIKEIMAGRRNPIGDNQEFAIPLRAGKRYYRVVLSYEEQPTGLSRHLSVSSAKQLQLEDVNDILRRFDFRAQLDHLDPVSGPPYATWYEDIGPKRSALNILEVVGGTLH